MKNSFFFKRRRTKNITVKTISFLKRITKIVFFFFGPITNGGWMMTVHGERVKSCSMSSEGFPPPPGEKKTNFEGLRYIEMLRK